MSVWGSPFQAATGFPAGFAPPGAGLEPPLINRAQATQYLRTFQLRQLFLEELGWDKSADTLTKTLAGTTYTFQAFAEKRSIVVFRCDCIPDYPTRLKLDRLISKDKREHLIVFADQSRGRQIWQWTRSGHGKTHAVRNYPYSIHQEVPELLLQKLDNLAVTLEEDLSIGFLDMADRLHSGIVDKVTKKFYERFKAEHARFLKFIEGIPDTQLQSWYASVMINRLMFLYFIQAKGFLNNDPQYLRTKLAGFYTAVANGEVPADAHFSSLPSRAHSHSYYRDFLCPLFFEGFARKKSERTATTNALLGDIPYLNGGLFQKHEIETRHGATIQIPNAAFDQIFTFFAEWNWHLDDRETSTGRDINPDVLGYIFEKYINNKQMGAYYTKEDITGYISQNTIIPFLLDATHRDRDITAPMWASIWSLLRENPDRYIYAAVRHGTDLPLPADIAVGIPSIPHRTGWNRTAPAEYGLPTEIWREVVERRIRCESVRSKLSSGEVHEVNDLITLNLDIRQFAEDVIRTAGGPELIRAFYKAIAKVSVLDPTCGSGAFLFAALNLLKPLYEACLDRIQLFVDELEAAGPHHPRKLEDFRDILAESAKHRKQDYFILKSIIVNNLYGVDIMEEAVEICKLRLFLKLVAHVDSSDRIEPLPDIDFNIRAGNTLVGYARLEDISKGQGNLLFEEQIAVIKDKAKTLDQALVQFREQQTKLNGTVTVEDKLNLRKRFADLDGELDDLLSHEYGVKKPGIPSWRASHKPFHWCSSFHGIMARNGFDVIIGNPPYLEYGKVRDEYRLQPKFADFLGNLYAACCFQSGRLLSRHGYASLIVPVSLPSTDRMALLRAALLSEHSVYQVSFSTRPQKLFDGAEQRLTIYIQVPSAKPCLYSGPYLKWSTEERTPQAFPGPLFARISFIPARPIASRHGIWPKVGKNMELAIVDRCNTINSSIGTLAVGSGASLYYKNTGLRYFNTTTLRPPKCWINGQATSSSRETTVEVRPEWRSAVHCVLVSSLFFFVYQATSNCRDLNPSDIVTFGLPKTLLQDARFDELSARIEDDCTAKGRVITMNHKLTGRVELESLSPAKSKPIIDEIDTILAQHYGLTPEELDFIINYDIKYRLGADEEQD